MELHEALRECVASARWSLEQAGFETGVTSGAVRNWLSGASTPAGDKLVLLMRKLPGFAGCLGFEMVDDRAA